jgi:CheY-like chemotaxis protein
MKLKSVFVLEDREALRLGLKTGLASYGLQVVVAKDLSEAREVLAHHGDVDVAMLDIQIQVNGGVENGLEFGLELKTDRKDWPPEFLVYSAFDRPDYYQLALSLGAAGYLRKGVYGGAPDEADLPPKIEVLAQHIRALALRRALHSERPGMTENLKMIAESCNSRDEAIDRFCKLVLIKEIRETLGDDFVLVVSHAGKTVWYSGTVPELPPGVVARIEAAVHSRLTDSEPLVIHTSELLSELSSAHRASLAESVDRIEGAVFTSLAGAKDFRLSLGLLPNAEESTVNQARLLDRYLQREVIAHLLQITEIWSELETKRKVLLAATSQFCLYESQEMLSVLFEAERNSEYREGLVPATRLRTIANEMRNAGEILMQFAQPDEANQWPGEAGVEMARLVDRVWSKEVSPRLRLSGQAVLRVAGACTASDREDRTARAVSQILGWMGKRLLRFEGGDEDLALFVSCERSAKQPRVKVIFEERRSHRLSRELRSTFFEPFYSQGLAGSATGPADGNRRLGLYLAHTLAHRAGGSLSDRSDELVGPLGHRLVLELPAALDA